MKNSEITCHAELIDRIIELKVEKQWQELELRQTFKEFAFTLNPVSIVKDSLHELVTDTQVKSDLLKVGLNLGANFLIDQITGRRSSIRGFLSSVLIEKLSSKFINNNLSDIMAGISKLMNKGSKIAH